MLLNLLLQFLQLYLQHLKPDGVLIVHISNVNLDLGPLVFRLADEIGMHAVRIGNAPFLRRVQSSADWMILSRNADYFEPFEPLAERIRAMLQVKPIALTLTHARDVDLAGAPLWTDDYSDLLSVLRKVPSWKRMRKEIKLRDAKKEQ